MASRTDEPRLLELRSCLESSGVTELVKAARLLDSDCRSQQQLRPLMPVERVALLFRAPSALLECRSICAAYLSDLQTPLGCWWAISGLSVLTLIALQVHLRIQPPILDRCSAASSHTFHLQARLHSSRLS